MLVVRLVGVRPLEDGLLVLRVGHVDAAGVVVLDLVVVPRDDPGERRVRRLQVLVHLVRRVAVAVVGEREGPPSARVVADAVAAGVALVDIVPEEDDGVQILFRERGVRRVVALGVVLARREREAERRGRRGGRGRGAGTADRALGPAGAEPVPVHPIRFEAGRVHVDRVREIGYRRDGAAADDVLERLVAGDAPLDVDRRGAHAATLERIHRQARPQDDGVGQRIA